MRKIFAIVTLIIFSITARAAFTPITHFVGPAVYGSRTITVSTTGATTTYFDPCLLTTLYWAGNTGPGSYIYNFSAPVYSINVTCDYLNSGTFGTGEYLSMKINGVFYSLTPADMISYNVCGLAGSALTSYLFTGFLMGPATAGFDYNGGIFTITLPGCSGINSCEVYCNGSIGGVTYKIGFDSVRAGSCVHAISNNPCIGDTIKFDMIGDSTLATYFWWGPGGWTSTLKNPHIFPSVFADSGLYHCVRTQGVAHDTDSVFVHVYPLPVIVLTNNAPLCSGLIDTLRISLTPATAGETFSWTGPNSFTSILQNPTKNGFSPLDVGTYSVTAISAYGCKASGTIYAGLVPPPPPPIITGDTSYCYGDPFRPFSVSAVGVVRWYPTATSTTGTTTAPTVNTSLAGTYTFYANQTIGSCESNKSSITVKVYPQIVPAFTTIINRGCDRDTVDFINNSTGATQYLWHFGDGTASSSATNPHHVYLSHALESVSLVCTGIKPSCFQTVTLQVDTRHSVTADFSIPIDTVCLGQPISMVDNSSATVYIPTGIASPGVITQYHWDLADGTTDASTNPTHTYLAAGYYTPTLTVTDSIGCTSRIKKDLYVLEVSISSFHDTVLCLTSPLLMRNSVTLYPNLVLPFTYLWTGSAGLSDTSAREPYFDLIGLYTYTFTATLNGYGCSAATVLTVNSIKGAPVTKVTASTTIAYGNSIQLNADNEVFYHWMPDDGSLNDRNISNPIATPSKTTLYTVYGYDQFGCLDSSYVTIYVDSTMVEDAPTGFTPNGDGLNDVYHLVGVKYRTLVDFRIYNRWGQQVFYTTNYKDGWDGNYNGVPQDVGTYFYTIVVARPGGEGDNKVYKGELTLIR